VSTTDVDHPELAPPTVEDLGGGLYAYVQPDGTWMINNTGILVGRDGVICLDSCSTQRRTEALLAVVTGLTDRPVRTLVNTHSHVDHVAGNGYFPTATIVAHEGTRATMLTQPMPSTAYSLWEPFDRGSVPVVPPFLTFADELTLWVDDLRCELRYVGRPAHTTNDSYLWVPSRGVLYAGDLVFHGGTPFCLAGSVTGLIEVLTGQIMPLQPTVIVPGHGPLADLAVVGDVVAYLRFVVSVAQAGIAAGLSPLDAARETDLGAFAAWSDPERIVGNLHRAYADLRGDLMDPGAALLDMVTYNGGRPLTCRA
jgi:cyclase